MTVRNSLKRRIRARMERTGDSYSRAREIVLRGTHDPKAADSLTVVLSQPDSRTGMLAEDLSVLFDSQRVPDCDILVLPELIGGKADPSAYEDAIRGLARQHACYVIGGSCYVFRNGGLLNAGIVVDRKGHVVTHYEKLRPYGSEVDAGVGEGSTIGQFVLEGRRVSVLICSDLWFSQTLTSLDDDPEVVIIPSFSITQRDDPTKPRELWKHMLIARAYEHAAYFGVCDWAHACIFDGLPAAGVSGFANPRPDDDSFYSANGDQHFRAYPLDFRRLSAFRENRASRGFIRRASDA
jgi:predicted amidohydrolase